MSTNSVITLDNDKNYLLLEKVEFESRNFFMAVYLNEDEEPTDEYMIFEEILEDNEKYVEEVEDERILSNLLELFTNKAKDFVDNNLPK